MLKRLLVAAVLVGIGFAAGFGAGGQYWFNSLNETLGDQTSWELAHQVETACELRLGEIPLALARLDGQIDSTVSGAMSSALKEKGFDRLPEGTQLALVAAKAYRTTASSLAPHAAEARAVLNGVPDGSLASAPALQKALERLKAISGRNGRSGSGVPNEP